MTRAASLLLCAALIGSYAGAQSPDTIYDETKVPQYSLPDPLVMKSGERVRALKHGCRSDALIEEERKQCDTENDSKQRDLLSGAGGDAARDRTQQRSHGITRMDEQRAQRNARRQSRRKNSLADGE